MKVDDPIRPSGRDEDAYRIAHLIAGYIRESLTQTEHQELDDWVTASDENQLLFEELTDESLVLQWLKWKEELPLPQALRNARQKRTPLTTDGRTSVLTGMSRWRRMLPIPLAVIMITLLFFLLRKPFSNSPVHPQNLKERVLMPGRWLATLRLDDGRLIDLDSLKPGLVAADGPVIVSKTDSGELRYETASDQASETNLAYHVLSVPSGGWYRVRLSDGSRIWLNAGSQLKYPASFGPQQRRVELAGEAWFEVAPNERSPFVVSCGQTTLQVLGTSFNVQGYSGDSNLIISLATGKLSINGRKSLSPGEQASVDENGAVVKSLADLESAQGWKEGFFVFRQAPVEEVMQSLARWYDAEIVYEAHPPAHFKATIPRTTELPALLHLLEATNEIHFRVEGKKIIVMK